MSLVVVSEDKTSRTPLYLPVEKIWWPWPTRSGDRRLFDRLEWSLALTFRMLQVPALSCVLLMPYSYVNGHEDGVFVMSMGLLCWLVRLY